MTPPASPDWADAEADGLYARLKTRISESDVSLIAAALREARDAGIEEAAKWAESHVIGIQWKPEGPTGTGERAGRAIRKLKGGGRG